jgi:hypothetical protein
MGELPELAICGCEWAFLRDLTTSESTSAVVLFQSPLQAKPFIARVGARPLEKSVPCMASHKPWSHCSIVGLGLAGQM